jgi:chorismate synthase
MGSIFGKYFRISTWGESHGGGIGVVIDGCPPQVPITIEEIQAELDRRKPGQSDISTPRKEADQARFVSGVFEGKTIGTPIAICVDNKDARPSAYDEMKVKFRPSHADFTYQTKYGHRNHEGGGRSSARETIGRVAAGAIAKKILKAVSGIEIRAFVTRIHNIEAPFFEGVPTLHQVEANSVRCPDPETATKMIARIKDYRSKGDSVGGLIQCKVKGVPVGLGDPVFDRLEANLAKAMLSLPATKGFEIGSGFEGTKLCGSEHNDTFDNINGEVKTRSNRSGGVQGGISNGEEIYFNVAFKPTATILQKQKTVDLEGNDTQLIGRGRHDPCVLPRAVPIVEAMTALVLLDHWMADQSQCKSVDPAIFS